VNCLLSASFFIISSAPHHARPDLSIKNISCSAPMRRTPDSNRSSSSMRSSACTSARIAFMKARSCSSLNALLMS